MEKTQLRVSAFLLGLSLLPSMAHAMSTSRKMPPPPDVSGLESEHAIGPATHSSARDQGDAGFCWAYSFSGLIEGEALKQGKSVTLSPEYLALSHIPYMIQSMYPMFDQADSGGLLNWILKAIIGNMFDPEGSVSLTESLDDLSNIGVVPETVFDYKFSFIKGDDGKLHEQHPTLQEKLEAFTKQNLLKRDKLEEYEANPDELREDIDAAIGVNLPKPTDSFTYEGQPTPPRRS